MLSALSERDESAAIGRERDVREIEGDIVRMLAAVTGGGVA